MRGVAIQATRTACADDLQVSAKGNSLNSRRTNVCVRESIESFIYIHMNINIYIITNEL